MVAHKAPLSMEFSGREYWSGLPCPPPGNLPDPGIKLVSLMSPALAGRFWTTSAPGKLINNVVIVSDGQWRDSAIYIRVSILPKTLFPSRLPHNIEKSLILMFSAFRIWNLIGPQYTFALWKERIGEVSSMLAITNMLLWEQETDAVEEIWFWKRQNERCSYTGNFSSLLST